MEKFFKKFSNTLVTFVVVSAEVLSEDIKLRKKIKQKERELRRMRSRLVY